MSKSMRPLNKKLKKCRDPDRVDLVALQKARREQGETKSKPKPALKDDGDLFGGPVIDVREAKRRKTAAEGGSDDIFGPALG
jgi:cyclin H